MLKCIPGINYYGKGQMNKKPKHVGTWVFAVTPQQEFMKWGKDGDTVFPYPPDDEEALAQAKYLSECPLHKTDIIFILHVFNNGQMKQFEYDPKEFNGAAHVGVYPMHDGDPGLATESSD